MSHKLSVIIAIAREYAQHADQHSEGREINVDQYRLTLDAIHHLHRTMARYRPATTWRLVLLPSGSIYRESGHPVHHPKWRRRVIHLARADRRQRETS